jgi:broad specificity phosphatase PhoE
VSDAWTWRDGTWAIKKNSEGEPSANSQSRLASVATVLLARHGETDWNRDHRWQGHTGPPLNQTGREQAARLAALLTSGVDAVYSSDTTRARETAEIIGTQIGLTVATDARLREVNFGEWEGLTRHEIDVRYVGAFTRWEACERPLPAGVEADEDMAQRVIEALQEIAARHLDGCVLVITSGGPIRAAEAHLRGIEQALARRELQTIANCALLELVIHDGIFRGPASGRFPAAS